MSGAVALLKLLQDKRWYSLAPSYVCKRLGIHMTQLEQLIKELDAADHQVNVFKYGVYTYIGLETRRIDYERDKKAGTNHVEEWIKDGVYD